MKDRYFIRGKVPMTKEEVRAIIVSKLELEANDNFMDIGAGTGSVSLEVASKINDGKVLAIEQKAEAIELIKANVENLKVSNVEIIQSLAPNGMEQTSCYNKFFIGGSKGNLKTIIETIKDNAPKEHIIVITAIVLDTMIEAYKYFKDNDNYEMELVQVAVNKIEPDKKVAMLLANNPVFIITAKSKIQVS